MKKNEIARLSGKKPITSEALGPGPVTYMPFWWAPYM